MVDKTRETPQTEVDKMTEKLTHRTMEQENEHFSHWIATETPFDENVGMVERGMKVAAAWQGWIACAASRDFDEMMSREPKTGPRCGVPETPKAARVRAIVDAGPFPGMSEAFDAHMGAACWTDPAYAPDASMWAAAWKAATAAERERCMGALDSHGRYWVENRSRIIDAVAAAGFRIVSDRDYCWLAPVGPNAGNKGPAARPVPLD